MDTRSKLYFDYNATTPVAPRVFEAMKPYLTDQWGNPGSAHGWGLAAGRAVDKARGQVASLINAAPEDILFTSCATESNNLVVNSPFAQAEAGRIITQPTEHPAVLEPCARLAEQGVAVTLLPVDGNGVADLDMLPDALGALNTGEAGLFSLMCANNETGVLQPVRDGAAQARKAGWLTHTDAAQAVAKIPVDVADLGVDYLTLAGHKMYAPKGIGALYLRPGAALYPLFLGGGQERGLRPGTENVAYIAGLGEACAMAAEDLSAEMARITALREQFIRGLREIGADFVIHGAGAGRLPGTCSVGFKGTVAGDVLSGLVSYDVAASGGAACHAGQTRLSPVLEAMHAPEAYAAGTIRFSFGRPTDSGEVEELLCRLKLVLEHFC